MPKCQSCDAPIMWRLTVDGRRVPLDPEPHVAGVVRMVPPAVATAPLRCVFLSKEVAAAARERGERLWLPHHASCASVERHRVPRAQLALEL